MAQEYSVTMVTAERVAISHLEITSRRSHSSFLSILTRVESAVPHIPKLMFIDRSPFRHSIPFGLLPKGLMDNPANQARKHQSMYRVKAVPVKVTGHPSGCKVGLLT